MSFPRFRRFRALVVMESLQVVRDPSSILIAFVLPVIMLFIFGYGISLDAARVRIGLVVEGTEPVAQDLAAAFLNSPYFDATVGHDRREVEGALQSGQVRALVIVPVGFAKAMTAGEDSPRIQVITDGAEPNTAHLVQNYVQGVWVHWLTQRSGPGARPPITIEARVWFNPELTSRNFLVPGSIAIVMTLIGTLLTALVVAREWERGTMEAMMATPVSVLEFLAGKLVPYFVLGLAAMAVSTLVAVGLFDVPLRGSFAALTLISVAFLCPSLGQGLLISAVTKNQFVASQMALFSGFLPAMILSGFIFEIDSMPPLIRGLSALVPARYFVSGLKTVFLAGDVWALLLPNIAIMLAIGAVFLGFAAKNTRKRLD